ncbi:MAG: glycosyltransferase [Halofilum sp. (in: g-proteobacteria)]
MPTEAAVTAATVSIVIPAHDEERALPVTLAHLTAALAQSGIAGEIIVVDNASADRTAEIAREHGAKVVLEPHRQISRARNTGARHAAAPYLMFVDADTRPPAELMHRALAELDAGACGGGALIAFDDEPNALYRRGLTLWNAVSRRFNWAAGCFVFARREAFEAIGGFDERVYAGDEVTFSRGVRRWGRSRQRPFVIIEDPPVRTSARKAHWFTPTQHLLMMLLALVPFALRSRRLMWFWYRRPGR